MKQSFLDKHGPKVGAALCALSAMFMIGVMVISFMVVAAERIEVRYANIQASAE